MWVRTKCSASMFWPCKWCDSNLGINPSGCHAHGWLRMCLGRIESVKSGHSLPWWSFSAVNIWSMKRIIPHRTSLESLSICLQWVSAYHFAEWTSSSQPILWQGMRDGLSHLRGYCNSEGHQCTMHKLKENLSGLEPLALEWEKGDQPQTQTLAAPEFSGWWNLEYLINTGYCTHPHEFHILSGILDMRHCFRPPTTHSRSSWVKLGELKLTLWNDAGVPRECGS